MKKHLANIITGCRILLSILMIFFPAFSVRFYIAYLLCGVSDMIDGTVARKTGGAGRFGARLDTAADLIFAAISFIKILPFLHIPIWIYIWITAIAGIKIIGIIYGFVRTKKFAAVHTVINKITGLLLFLLPLTLNFIDIKYSSIAVCAVATAAAIQEGYCIITGREVD